MTEATEKGACSLCRIPLRKPAIIDESETFCCHGCHAVFRILEAKGRRDNYLEEPVFQEALRAGLISNPSLLKKMRDKCREREKLYFELEELWCPSCAEVIELVLAQGKGILRCGVDYSTDLGVVEFDPLETSKQEIFSRIRRLGYLPRELAEREESAESHSLRFRMIVASFCALNVMMFSYPLYAQYFFPAEKENSSLFIALAFLFALPVVFYAAFPIFRRFLQGLKVGIVGMEALISIGVASAFSLSLLEVWRGREHIYLDSMSVIIAFVIVGKTIERKAKFSAKQSLIRLTRALPRKGRRREGNFVDAKEIQVGEILRVLAGEKFILDGIVTAGEGGVDEAVVTGESVPVYKQSGGEIVAGSVLQNGWIEFQVTKTFQQSGLKEIVSMIERDLGRKGEAQKVTDRVSFFFVLLALVISSLAFFLHGFAASLSVLLISCPCALGIAAPLVEARLMHALAAAGAQVRNRGILSLLGRETATIFDKTGTVTEGVFQVLQIPAREVKILKGMTAMSSHPLSRAIHKALELATPPLDVQEISGKGLQSGEFRLGSKRWMEEEGIVVGEEGETTVYFAQGKNLLGTILLGDRIRPSAYPAVKYARGASLLSGDLPSVVEKVARELSIATYQGGIRPLEKKEWVDSLRERGEIVYFIGDGINDAPAIAAASVGISVWGASDLSANIADMTLQTEDLTVLGKIGFLGRRARRLIGQNLFWAFAYNTVGIGLALSGLLSPIYSAAAMVLSSTFVLLNSNRLRHGVSPERDLRS